MLTDKQKIAIVVDFANQYMPGRTGYLVLDKGKPWEEEEDLDTRTFIKTWLRVMVQKVDLQNGKIILECETANPTEVL